MKKIADQKLQAFTVGTMGKRQLSRKELEEQKKREDEAAAAHAFKEFVETFQEAPSKISKVWVKAGTYDAGSRKEDVREKGKLYKPSSRLESEQEKVNDYVKMLANESKKDLLLPGAKKKSGEKKKSNLELFKEELRLIQEEREERHKYKNTAKSMLPVSIDPDPPYNEGNTKESGSFDNGDPNTTNLYLGNLNPKISEQALMELFGKYGPLASIKIMWPRSEEERARGRNCGFVAYMSRRDAERALRALNGKDVMNYEMKLGWGKSVPIMTHPIYIPPALVAYTLPPPPSGLPFNAQPHPSDLENIPKMTSKMYMDEPEQKEKMDNVLYKSSIKVVIPTERPLLMLIHRMVEFVIREGPMFEALIMTREMENPMYKFLFENESPAHIYYRWKLFSLLQGDTVADWRVKEFRMFKGGSIWKPPPINFYTQGMPDELLVDLEGIDSNKGNLSVAQRDRLEDLLRHLTPERQKIADTMIFCIEHADAAEEICDCIAESLSSNDTMVKKKVARIYLISDILHNCSVKVQNASFFRKALEKNLMDIFKSLNSYHMQLDSRLKAEGFKSRVMNVFRAWDEWVVYPKEFLSRLQHTFLGIPIVEKKEEEEPEEENEDEDLDGIPLDGAALLKSAMLKGMTETDHRTPILKQGIYSDEEDIDGMPMEDDIDGVPLDNSATELFPAGNSKSKVKGTGSFIPSKWETVDASQIEAQAITTSKWDTLDPVAPEPPHIKLRDDSDDEHTTKGDEEARRQRLREIEVKIVQYQDEFESGSRQVRVGWTMGEEIAHYRRKLIKKAEKELRQQQLAMAQQQSDDDTEEDTDEYERTSKKGSKRSVSPEISRKHKKSRRSPSSEYLRETTAKSSRRSRSPVYTSSSRSKRDSLSPPARASSSKTASSRHRLSRSSSRSPTRRHHERSISPATRSKYDLLESPARVSSKYESTSSSSKYEKYETASSSSKYDSRLYEDARTGSSSSKYEKYDKYEIVSTSSGKHDRERERERDRDRDRERDRERDIRERERDRDRDRLYSGGSSSKYETISSKYDDGESRKYRSPSPRGSSSRDSYRYSAATGGSSSGLSSSGTSRIEKHKKHKY
ncbi:U2 snRNP-associated SURP motif-containing protein [Uranotaenia lowii]|uniref:U2 snRNP-associated SURP motif-containing protein n=1 Tax=Uranotaenia lowii TaxID=190385 RepID=UPI002479C7C9|nr:U2 snRNP-associated SURP motif-containing protein [Uranotaenia lowii]